MNIRFVAVPAEIELAPPAAAAARALGAGVARGPFVETEVDAGGDPAVDKQIRATIAGFEQLLSAGSKYVSRLRLETDPTALATTAGEVSIEPTAWTPEAAKLKDLNGSGANAALPKVLGALEYVVPTIEHSNTERAVLMASASNRFLALHPCRGAHIALAECLRDLACAAVPPVCVGDRYEVPPGSTALELLRGKESMRGIAEACACVELPVVSTTLSVADSWSAAIAVAGLLPEAGAPTPSMVHTAGQKMVLLGEAPNEIGGSHFLQAVHGLASGGAAPLVDLVGERRLHQALIAMGTARVLLAARSVAVGGLLIAVCRMLPADSLGARLDLTSLGGARADALLFGESQGRAIVTVAPERVGTVLSEAHMRGVPAALIGEVIDDPILELKTRSLATEWQRADLPTA